MLTNFAEIDAAVTEALHAPGAPPPAEVKAKSTRVVAGFHLHDPSLEDEVAGQAAEEYRGTVEAFQIDREEATAVCSARGIKPLAVIPTSTWGHLCEAAGLFRLVPDREGVVFFSPRAFAGIKTEKGMTGAQQVEWLAKNDRAVFLRRLFPGGVSPTSGYKATLVMPIPPADVAEILLKARDLDLKVATVAEAISFKETPTQMYEHVLAVEEARAKALRDDPIIYFEHGSATAILAQFGDFPIELETVRMVLSAETLIRFFPNQVRV